MGFNPFKAAENKAKDAVNGVVKKVLNPAIRKAEDMGRSVERKAKSSVNWADDKIDDIQDEAIKRVREVGEEVEDGLTEKLPDLVEDAAKAIAEKAAEGAIEKALNEAADGIEMMAPDELAMTFGVEVALVVQGEVSVTVVMPNPVAKLTEVRAWAKNPPKGRAQIIQCIGDFAPSSLSAGFKVCGNGPDYTWNTGDKLTMLDRFLAKHGVD